MKLSLKKTGAANRKPRTSTPQFLPVWGNTGCVPASILLYGTLILCCLVGQRTWAASLEIELSLTPEQTNIDLPITIDVTQWLSEDDISKGGSWQLKDLTIPDSPKIPCQISTCPAVSQRWLSFIIKAKPSEHSVTHQFRLSRSDTTTPPAFRLDDLEEKYLRLTEDDRPVFVYNYGMVLAKGVSDRYRRSCYIHPVYDLDGIVISDDFPRDHRHHRGLFWAWPVVKVGGKQYDPWAVRGLPQKFQKWLAREVGPVCAIIGVSNGWYQGGQKVVREMVWIRVFRSGEFGRAIDFELTLEATEQPVTISGRPPHKGYGGFTFRFAPRRETALYTSAGPLKTNVDTKRFEWSDLSAKFGKNERISGVAIFNHPDAPLHPCGWTNRFYGILNPAWPGLDSFTLEPGKPLRLRYRLWVHRGDAIAGHAGAAYTAFANPPKARVKKVD